MKLHFAVFCIVVFAVTGSLSAQPNIDLESWEDWMAALGIEVEPMSPAEWADLPPGFTDPFGGPFLPSDPFAVPPPIPPWEGDPPDDDDDGGLVMPWGPPTPGEDDSVTGWKLVYPGPPLDTTGKKTKVKATVPKPKTTAPDPERGQKIDEFGVAVRDILGGIRAWLWDCDATFGPGTLAWNDDFELDIDIAPAGMGSEFDAAYGPEGGALTAGDVAFIDTGFDPTLTAEFVFIASGEMLPGGQAAPPDYPLPGGEDMMWMYFDELTVPGGPLVGDFDDDGDVDADDVDELCGYIGLPPCGGDYCAADLDEDGDIDGDDVAFLVTNYVQIYPGPGFGTFLGDLNFDGVVNGTDLSIMNQYVGMPAGYAGGNPNCDAIVNGTDLSILAGSFGSVVTADVPEPMTISLLGLGSLVILIRRSR